MSHLMDEELEDILWGGAGVPEHLNWCRRCSARLSEKYVLADRVHRAFVAIHAGSHLTDRIQGQIATAELPAVGKRA